MNVLIVYWNLHSMSDAVAKKSQFGSKTYKVTRMRTNFAETVRPEDAISQITERWGAKPEVGNSIYTGHRYAEIRYWKIAPFFQPEMEKPEKLDQALLFDIEKETKKDINGS